MNGHVVWEIPVTEADGSRGITARDASKIAVKTAEEGHLEGSYEWKQVEYNAFDASTNEYGYSEMRLKYRGDDKKNNKIYAYGFNYYYYPDERMMLMIKDQKDITDQVTDDMSDEEIDNLVADTAEGINNNLSKTFLKAFVQQLEGEDRWEIVFNDVLKDINNYLPGDGDGMTEEDKKEVSSKASIALTVITYIGTVASVVMLGVIGIKYMLGSVEQRADYKQDLVPYVVGAVMLFGISTIAEILKLIGENINNI